MLQSMYKPLCSHVLYFVAICRPRWEFILFYCISISYCLNWSNWYHAVWCHHSAILRLINFSILNSMKSSFRYVLDICICYQENNSLVIPRPDWCRWNSSHFNNWLNWYLFFYIPDRDYRKVRTKSVRFKAMPDSSFRVIIIICYFVGNFDWLQF